MKVTAIIPDDLVNDVKKHSGGKNITESLIIALEEWLSLKKIMKLNLEVKKNPLAFQKDITHSSLRSLNRNR